MTNVHNCIYMKILTVYGIHEGQEYDIIVSTSLQCNRANRLLQPYPVRPFYPHYSHNNTRSGVELISSSPSFPTILVTDIRESHRCCSASDYSHPVGGLMTTVCAQPWWIISLLVGVVGV